MEHKSETKKGEMTMRGKYLTPNEKLWDEIPKGFLTEQNTWRLLDRQEQALLTEGQLYSYERYWMSVIDNRILRQAAYKKGFEQGYKEGYENYSLQQKKVIAKGVEKGRIEEKLDNARNLKNNGVSIDLIAKSLGLSPEEIEHL